MHHRLQTSLIAAATAACLAASPAAGAGPHTLLVQLPDGAVEQIQYAGDIPPQVVLGPAPVVAPMAAVAMDPFFPDFARLTALMDQQEAAMMRLAASAAAYPAAAFANLPAGTTTYVATFSTDGACIKRTEITYAGNGAAPRLVSDTEGDCGPGHVTAPAQRVRHPHIYTAPNQARLIQARATAPALLRDAVWRQP